MRSADQDTDGCTPAIKLKGSTTNVGRGELIISRQTEVAADIHETGVRDCYSLRKCVPFDGRFFGNNRKILLLLSGVRYLRNFMGEKRKQC